MPKKPQHKFRTMTVRLTVKEYEAIQAMAYSKDQYVSPYVRELVVKAAKRAGNLDV